MCTAKLHKMRARRRRIENLPAFFLFSIRCLEDVLLDLGKANAALNLAAQMDDHVLVHFVRRFSAPRATQPFHSVPEQL